MYREITSFIFTECLKSCQLLLDNNETNNKAALCEVALFSSAFVLHRLKIRNPQLFTEQGSIMYSGSKFEFEYITEIAEWVEENKLLKKIQNRFFTRGNRFKICKFINARINIYYQELNYILDRSEGIYVPFTCAYYFYKKPLDIAKINFKDANIDPKLIHIAAKLSINFNFVFRQLDHVIDIIPKKFKI